MIVHYATIIFFLCCIIIQLIDTIAMYINNTVYISGKRQKKGGRETTIIARIRGEQIQIWFGGARERGPPPLQNTGTYACIYKLNLP